MPRTIKTFSVDLELSLALASRAKALGVSQSSLLEEGIRFALDIPRAVEPTQGPPERLPASERMVLTVLKAKGSGAHSGVELAEATGYSFAITERACKALALRGQVHRWGDAPRFSDGTAGGGYWGLRSGPDEVRRVIDAWRGRGSPREQELALIDLVRKLTGLMDAAGAAQARTILAEALQLDPSALE